MLCAVARSHDGGISATRTREKCRIGPILYEAKLTAVPELSVAGDLFRRQRQPTFFGSISRPTLRSCVFRGVCLVRFLSVCGFWWYCCSSIYQYNVFLYFLLCFCVFDKFLALWRKLLVSDAIRSPRAALKQERKRALMETADCIITLPGGLGTWDELWEIVCLKGIGE